MGSKENATDLCDCEIIQMAVFTVLDSFLPTSITFQFLVIGRRLSDRQLATRIFVVFEAVQDETRHSSADIQQQPGQHVQRIDAAQQWLYTPRTIHTERRNEDDIRPRGFSDARRRSSCLVDGARLVRVASYIDQGEETFRSTSDSLLCPAFSSPVSSSNFALLGTDVSRPRLMSFLIRMFLST